MADSEYTPLTPQEIGEGIALSKISEMGGILPPGKYKVKLVRVKAQDSKAGNPMVVAGFEVVEAFPIQPKVPTPDSPLIDPMSLVGLEATAFYSMYVGKNLAGRIIAPGIMEIKATCAAIGTPLPPDFIFPSDVKQAARLVHDNLHPKKVGELEAIVSKESRKDKKTGESVVSTKLRIIGRWGQSGSVELGQAATGGAPDARELEIV